MTVTANYPLQYTSETQTLTMDNSIFKVKKIYIYFSPSTARYFMNRKTSLQDALGALAGDKNKKTLVRYPKSAFNYK